MSLKHLWSILCRESIINDDDKTLHLNGVLETLTITLTPKKPNIKSLPKKLNAPINYEVVSYWYREKATKQILKNIKYTLSDPDGNELFSTIKEIKIAPKIKRLRSRMKISGFPVRKAGVYFLDVSIQDKGSKYNKLVGLPLDVKINIQDKQLKN